MVAIRKRRRGVYEGRSLLFVPLLLPTHHPAPQLRNLLKSLGVSTKPFCQVAAREDEKSN